MGTRTSYAPGLFCWVDVQVPDVDQARAFYGEVLGWETSDDSPIATVGGEAVAAIVPLPPSSPHAPHLNSYVATDDADAVTARVEDLGGMVIERPFSIGALGRLALFIDPTGAAICLWEAGEHFGAGRVNEVGCLTFNEVNTTDVDKAIPFYEGLFGWTFEDPIDIGHGGNYRNLRNGDRLNGGARHQTQPERDAGLAPHWLPYFQVQDTRATAALTEQLGGRVQMPPLDLPAGPVIAQLVDPAGAHFAVFQGETDD